MFRVPWLELCELRKLIRKQDEAEDSYQRKVLQGLGWEFNEPGEDGYGNAAWQRALQMGRQQNGK